MLLCKYMGPVGVTSALKHSDGLTIRFNLPNDYNDPFELYLERDGSASAELRAFFDFYLGELQQLPTSCFSHLADSAVMWAHYAENSKGACLIFDEDKLCDCFSGVGLGDVKYKDSFPVEHLESLNYAFATGKPRHMHFTLAAAYKSAYFTKHKTWAYECERRLVVLPDEVYNENGITLAKVNGGTLEAIVVGAKVDQKVYNICEKSSKSFNVKLYQVKFSRIVNRPFFVEIGNDSIYSWSRAGFVLSGRICNKCHEPIIDDVHPKTAACPWCAITEKDRREANARNLYGLIRHYELDYPSLPLPGDVIKGRMANVSEAEKGDILLLRGKAGGTLWPGRSRIRG